MTNNSLNALEVVRKHLESPGGFDPLAEMVKTFAQALMPAAADAICSAGYGERSPERVNSRNGYCSREWETRAGTIEPSLPKLRTGRYFPGWTLEPRRRAKRAMVAVATECYVRGVSTRRVERLVAQLRDGEPVQIAGVGDGQEPRCRDRSVRGRPFGARPYTYVSLDALTQRVRESGRIVNVAVVFATG